MADVIGGIDLGGTKIEARLFAGPGAVPGPSCRIATPQEDAGTLLAALAEMAAWLRAEAGGPLPIGLSLPGYAAPGNGAWYGANLPAGMGELGPALESAMGQPVPALNDAMALTLSEVTGGAAEGAASALGVVIGTGLGAGYCVDGRPARRPSGQALEIGFLGISAALRERHGLPLWPCACGRMGCAEAYIAGPGLTRLAEWKTGQSIAPDALVPMGREDVLEIWADLLADVLRSVQIMLDPEAIVLAGGVSLIPDATTRVDRALQAMDGPGLPTAPLRLAAFGDASGARGAALWAQQALAGC